MAALAVMRLRRLVAVYAYAVRPLMQVIQAIGNKSRLPVYMIICCFACST